MDVIPPFTGFTRKTWKFYENLSMNNDREWFKANKDEYAEVVLKPAQSFVVALGKKLQKISKGIQYDPQTSGRGSIFRIHRDIRFSKDKTPYNTNLRVVFWEGPWKRTANPSFFLRLGLDGGAAYVGMHGFEKPMLEGYRRAIVDDQMGLKLAKAIKAVQNAGDYTIGEQGFKRVPRGYDPLHKYSPLLLHKSLYAVLPKIKKSLLTKPELVDVVFNHFKKMSPIHKWLVLLVGSLTP
jgi:uncharacterized protein (TIGR02453 family)